MHHRAPRKRTEIKSFLADFYDPALKIEASALEVPRRRFFMAEKFANPADQPYHFDVAIRALIM